MPDGTVEASLQSVTVEDGKEGLIAMKWVVTNHGGRPLNGGPMYISDPSKNGPSPVLPMVMGTTAGEQKLEGMTHTIPGEWPTTFTLRLRVGKDWNGLIIPCFYWETDPPCLVGTGRRWYVVAWKNGTVSVSMKL